MRARSEEHPALHDRGMSRGSHLSGSPAEYTKSPLSRFWAAAEDSRADASEKIALIREQHLREKQPFAGMRWRRRKGNGS